MKLNTSEMETLKCSVIVESVQKSTTSVNVLNYIPPLLIRLCFVVLSVGPKILTYVTKVIIQSLQLLLVLLRMEIQSYILMQVLGYR